MDRGPIPSLTGIRFFAAFYVVWYHYAPQLSGPLANVAHNGYLAVALFFVLSGFVLAYNYEGRRTDPRRFWVARFARIYPAYLLAFLLMAPAVCARLLHVNPGRLVASGVAASTLMQGWYPPLALVWNGPGWSLASEAFFYLLFPALLATIARLSTRGLGLAAVVCSAAAALPIAALQWYSGDNLAVAATYIPLFRLAEFSLGVTAGLLFVRGKRLRGWMPLTAAALTAFAVFSPEYVPAALRPGLAAPLFALFIFALASDKGMCSRLLGRNLMVELGDASYSVYILQSPLMAFFVAATQGIGASAERAPLSWSEFAVYACLLVGSSLACYRWIETPVRRYIVARWSARSPSREPFDARASLSVARVAAGTTEPAPAQLLGGRCGT